MIYINVDPVVSLGSIKLSWTSIGLSVSFAVIIIMGIMEIRRRCLSIGWIDIIGLSAYFIAGTFIVGRLFAVLENLDLYVQNQRALIGHGLVIYGVLIGALSGIALYTKLRNLPFWHIGDVIAPGAMLGMTLYRIGCIVCGCCYGLPTSLPWAVTYVHPDSYAPINVAMHPTQMYHFILGLIAFIILWVLRDRLKPEGTLFLLWVILFTAGDLTVRFFRDTSPVLAGWQLAQIVDTIVLAIALPGLIIRVRRRRQE
jgi:phosphatidylglycerol:prolipoprotein diacylglycerol transferase